MCPPLLINKYLHCVAEKDLLKIITCSQEIQAAKFNLLSTAEESTGKKGR